MVVGHDWYMDGPIEFRVSGFLGQGHGDIEAHNIVRSIT